MSRERGFALPIVMVLVLLTAALGSAVAQREQTVRRDSRTGAEARRSVHAAEGGIAHARHRLASDAGYAGETLTIGACEVTLHVVENEAEGWIVTSAASPGGARLEVHLLPASGLPQVARFTER